MPLTNWWQVATPHKDIIKGKFDESIFAADLGDVILKKAPLEYLDGAMFFDKTYLTKGLEELSETVLLRLSKSKKGQSVIQLQTPFGGGKTHALLCLYHIFTNGKDIAHTDAIKSLLKLVGLKSIPKVKVAGFVGTHADALGGRTPWGEIAHQLGAYDIVKDHDKKRIAPGKEVLSEMLDKAGPTLILIDELLEYVVKKDRAEKLGKIEQGQTAAFLQEISEVVAGKKDAAMVLTLPSSALEQYDERSEKALSQLQKISGRVESIYTPVEGVEIYEIIRKRLFEDIGKQKIHKEVAQSFFSLYHDLGEDVPEKIRSTEYRDRIEKSYPFHPELIDCLYERWGSYSKFQRTRGTLRLLAEALGQLYKDRFPSPVILSSMMPLSNTTVRREFLKYTGPEIDSLIAADIGNKGSRAPQIDKQMGSEYAKQNIATSLATAVFLYSFSGSARKGLNIRELRVTILKEGFPKTIVGDAVQKLEEELWYFHASSGNYSFKNQANLNRVIVDTENQVKDAEINDELRSILQKNMGRAIETILWPKSTSDIPDSRKIKLAVLGTNMTHPGTAADKFTEEIYTKAGAGFRVYKNGLMLLAMDENSTNILSKHVRRLLALELVQKDEGQRKNIAKNDLLELSKKSNASKSQIPYLLHSAYRYLGHLTDDGVRWIDLGMPTIGAFSSLSDRVKEHLCDEELMLTQISPQVILKHTKLGGEEEKNINDIFEMYLKTPGLPLLQSKETLLGGIRIGVQNSLFGLKMETGVVFGKAVFDIEGEMNIIGKSLAEKSTDSTEEELEEEEKEDDNGKKDEKKDDPAVKLVKSLTISSNVPWDQLSSLISGVIGPLKEKDAKIQIKMQLKALSETGFDRTTLDSKIKETLQQIGAEIDLWQED